MGRTPPRPFTRADDHCWIEVSGIVQRLLHDDRDGASHQRFVLDLRNGQTLLVAHNIEVAARVPLGLGARVDVRGLYEWNDLGGLVHWTHDDPHGQESGGYIRYAGRTYQ
jgi:hypothetical protein